MPNYFFFIKKKVHMPNSKTLNTDAMINQQSLTP